MSILKAFTGHLIEFVNEIRNVFPNDCSSANKRYFSRRFRLK